ncbi:unnamed protein product, partial [Discosporangium mesarthrocarpum]
MSKYSTRRPMSLLHIISLSLAHAFSFIALAMVIYWATAEADNTFFLGGLGFSGNALFNWHPVLMVAGMVTAFTQAILAYRTLPLGKETNKKIHGAFMLLACVFITLGLVAVFQYHNEELYANLYTMHSWAGIAVVTLFFANYVGGFISFFAGLVPQSIKERYLPKHTFLGVFTYIAAAFTVVLGIQDKNSMMGCGYSVTLEEADVNPASHYGDIYAGCRLSNGLGIVVIVTCLLASFVVMDR